jgi:hypothetical protein
MSKRKVSFKPIKAENPNRKVVLWSGSNNASIKIFPQKFERLKNVIKDSKKKPKKKSKSKKVKFKNPLGSFFSSLTKKK